MAVNRRNIQLDTFSPDQTEGIYKDPIVSGGRAPTTGDKADIGSIWINKATDTAYILTSISAGLANWENFTDEVTAAGTDGQLWIGATGAAAAWANLTSTGLSVTITNTANGINLEAAGVAALTSLDADGGTATPVAGVIIVAGGTNITTAGVAGTLTVNLDASPSVAGSLTAATSITAGVDLIMSTGTCTITSDDDSSEAIYLHADAGTSETIHLHANQGTDPAAIELEADVGGITLDSGLASADAINLYASDAGGGIDIDAGTGGVNINATNGAIVVTSGTGNITLGTDAAAHNVTVGSTNTTSGTTIQSGTGDLALTSTDDITIDGAGVLEINSSAGVIGIGNDADAQDINIGTGAAARIITIGNGSAAAQVDINCGTGDVTVGANATAHTVTVGSTNTTSNVIVQSGTGGIQVTSGGVYAMDATDAVTIESSAGTIGIGADAVAQDINIGTGAAARTVTIGNATAAASVVINAGTGAVDIGANAVAHTTTVGSVTAAADTTLQAGTGALTIDGLGAIDIDAAGALGINSDGGAINIGTDADAQAVNVGTGGAARPVALGSTNTTSATTVQAGTGALTIDGLGIIDVDAAGALSLNSDGGVINIGDDADAQNMNIGTGAAARVIQIGNATGATEVEITGGSAGITLTPTLGIMTAEPLETSDAGVATTASGNLISCTFTGQTTASAAEEEFTITNTIITVGSAIFATASNIGANDAQMTVTRVFPKAGSVVVTLTNYGAAALNGDVIINLWVIKA